MPGLTQQDFLNSSQAGITQLLAAQRAGNQAVQEAGQHLADTMLGTLGLRVKEEQANLDRQQRATEFQVEQLRLKTEREALDKYRTATLRLEQDKITALASDKTADNAQRAVGVKFRILQNEGAASETEMKVRLAGLDEKIKLAERQQFAAQTKADQIAPSDPPLSGAAALAQKRLGGASLLDTLSAQSRATYDSLRRTAEEQQAQADALRAEQAQVIKDHADRSAGILKRMDSLSDEVIVPVTPVAPTTPAGADELPAQDEGGMSPNPLLPPIQGDTTQLGPGEIGIPHGAYDPARAKVRGYTADGEPAGAYTLVPLQPHESAQALVATGGTQLPVVGAPPEVAHLAFPVASAGEQSLAPVSEDLVDPQVLQVLQNTPAPWEPGSGVTQYPDAKITYARDGQEFFPHHEFLQFHEDRAALDAVARNTAMPETVRHEAAKQILQLDSLAPRVRISPADVPSYLSSLAAADDKSTVTPERAAARARDALQLMGKDASAQDKLKVIDEFEQARDQAITAAKRQITESPLPKSQQSELLPVVVASLNAEFDGAKQSDYATVPRPKNPETGLPMTAYEVAAAHVYKGTFKGQPWSTAGKDDRAPKGRDIVANDVVPGLFPEMVQGQHASAAARASIASDATANDPQSAAPYRTKFTRTDFDSNWTLTDKGKQRYKEQLLKDTADFDTVWFVKMIAGLSKHPATKVDPIDPIKDEGGALIRFNPSELATNSEGFTMPGLYSEGARRAQEQLSQYLQQGDAGREKIRQLFAGLAVSYADAKLAGQ